MNISPLIKISKEQFEAYRPERNESSSPYLEERGWFQTEDRHFIAAIEIAVSCDDWSYSIYAVTDGKSAPQHSYGCDRNSEDRITELLVASVRKFYRNVETEKSA